MKAHVDFEWNIAKYFGTLSEAVLLGRSLKSPYTISWWILALSSSLLQIYLEFHASLDFCIVLFFVNPCCFKCILALTFSCKYKLINYAAHFYIPGLDKLRAWWRACAQRVHKEIFACTKLRVQKSIKTPLSSTSMLFKVVSLFLCLKTNNIQHKIWHP